MNKSIKEYRDAFTSYTHLFPMHPFATSENIRKPEGFLMFSGGREWVHWE